MTDERNLPPIGAEDRHIKLKGRIRIKADILKLTEKPPKADVHIYNSIISTAWKEIESKRRVMFSPLITLSKLHPRSEYPWVLEIQLTHKINEGAIIYINYWAEAIVHAVEQISEEDREFYDIEVDPHWRENIDAAIEELKVRSAGSDVDYVFKHD